MLRKAGCLTIVLVWGFVACGGDDSSAPGPITNSGGAAGSASGGAAGAAGAKAGHGGAIGGAAGSSTGGTAGTGGGAAGSSAGGTAGTGGGAAGSSTGGTAGGPTSDIPGGGQVLFQEKFDDADFAARGWYDGSNGTISSAEHAAGSASSYECAFVVGATSCSSGKPARHALPASETVYLSFWLKFSSNWVGSAKPYHPHMFHFINDVDDTWVGPSHTYLTTYTEVVDGKAMLALQDSKNVDLSCILRNDDSFVGCNGDFNAYAFTEDRSICACNGLMGDLDGRDCFPNGDGTWYSSRAWRGAGAFVDTPGPNYKADWHFVEVYFAMNSIQSGKGVADGKIRWVQDGKTLISSDQVILRSGAHPTLKFNQFAMLPYIGDGSPIDQQFWVDDLTVATARP